jgi:hypothetical protein
MGSAFQTVYREPKHAELPTSGGEFQFDGPRARRSRNMKRGPLGAVPVVNLGNTVCGMGDLWSDITSSLEKGAATAAGALIQSSTGQPVAQAAQQVAVESAGAKAFAWAQTHWKQIAVGAVGTLAVVGGIFYFMGRKRS